MYIDLSDQQADVLRTVLDTTLRDLSYEIASADLPTYRQMLRGQREALRPVLDALGGPIPVSQRFSN
jgi:hypothetical protein